MVEIRLMVIVENEFPIVGARDGNGVGNWRVMHHDPDPETVLCPPSSSSSPPRLIADGFREKIPDGSREPVGYAFRKMN